METLVQNGPKNLRLVADGQPAAGADVRLVEVAPNCFDCHVTTTDHAPVTLRWEVPATGVAGVWTTGSLYEKRLRADWEAPDRTSRVSVDAPVLCAFGHRDENICCIAVSDALNTATLRAPVREEDNHLHCAVELFAEDLNEDEPTTLTVRIDLRGAGFSETLDRVRQWWEEASGLTPMPVPEAGREPVYSSWYAYHQNVSNEALLAECRIAQELGCGVVIVDDGWQTLDGNRGYDFTGDWEPDRMTDLRGFTGAVHDLGMRAMLWFSVPFCGVQSAAYQRFRGKFLTENHRWAPVFDPRYPEVRAYLIEKYERAVRDWCFDGLKLDFIDDFRVYPETPPGRANGRDYASVNAATERLLRDVHAALTAIRSDLLIEFRQRYVGPVIRRYGNMFRAFDCPADAVTNRLRTTDLRLICGSTAVHSDMLTWHPDSPVEVAALQLNNVLFSVPQISIQLPDAPAEIREMIGHYLNFYNRHRAVLLDGRFTAFRPLQNYPLLRAERDGTVIFGHFAPQVVALPETWREVHLINGSLETAVVLRSTAARSVRLRVVDCRGRVVEEVVCELGPGIMEVAVPAGGILSVT